MRGHGKNKNCPRPEERDAEGQIHNETEADVCSSQGPVERHQDRSLDMQGPALCGWMSILDTEKMYGSDTRKSRWRSDDGAFIR